MKHILPIAIVFIIILIAGCCGSVTSADIDKAKELCKQNGDLSYISKEFVGYSIFCNNGAIFRIDATISK